MEQTQVQGKTPVQSKAQAPTPAPQAAPFQELKPGANGAGGQRDMDFLLDVPLEITVELGRTRMLIKDLLQLGQGSVVELQKIAGEPMEILVNNKLVARGEVVVVNEKFGVRLTDIISPTERIQQLK
jgi:flagellar motor switch protein FliN/FliY